MNRDWKRFVRSHNLVNRVYDMLFYLKVLKNNDNEKNTKRFFYYHLEDVEYVESLAKYFENQLKKYKSVADIRCNLLDLIQDLNYLKQYLI